MHVSTCLLLAQLIIAAFACLLYPYARAVHEFNLFCYLAPGFCFDRPEDPFSHVQPGLNHAPLWGIPPNQVSFLLIRAEVSSAQVRTLAWSMQLSNPEVKLTAAALAAHLIEIKTHYDISTESILDSYMTIRRLVTSVLEDSIPRIKASFSKMKKAQFLEHVGTLMLILGEVEMILAREPSQLKNHLKAIEIEAEQFGIRHLHLESITDQMWFKFIRADGRVLTNMMAHKEEHRRIIQLTIDQLLMLHHRIKETQANIRTLISKDEIEGQSWGDFFDKAVYFKDYHDEWVHSLNAHLVPIESDLRGMLTYLRTRINLETGEEH